MLVDGVRTMAWKIFALNWFGKLQLLGLVLNALVSSCFLDAVSNLYSKQETSSAVIVSNSTAERKINDNITTVVQLRECRHLCHIFPSCKIRGCHTCVLTRRGNVTGLEATKFPPLYLGIEPFENLFRNSFLHFYFACAGIYFFQFVQPIPILCWAPAHRRRTRN